MDEVIFRFYADSNAQFQALKSGEIDALDGVPEQSTPASRTVQHHRDRWKPGWVQRNCR
jgi:ABC-type transport system substrate-binding protein